MLRFLAVRHLAVIDRLEVEFEPGLNVLTGETGAGKTMLVEAIDLLVGRTRQRRSRAHRRRSRDGAGDLRAAGGADVIVRREVSAQGRSRAFIDDTLATTAALRELGSRHVDLHGQHEHQALLDPSEHVQLLDAFAGHDERVATVGEHFVAWRPPRRRSNARSLASARSARGSRSRRFSCRKSIASRRRDGEDETLTAERRVLANADRLGRLCADAYAALYEGEQAALDITRRGLEACRRAGRTGPALRSVPGLSATTSSRGSRTSHSSSARTAPISKRRRTGCRRSKIGWPRSSG